MGKYRHLSSGSVLPAAQDEPKKKLKDSAEKPNKKDETKDTGRSHDMNSMAFHDELESFEDELIDFINQNKGKSEVADLADQRMEQQGMQPGMMPMQPGMATPQPGTQQQSAAPAPNQAPAKAPAKSLDKQQNKV
jgi:hypothetical protein